MANVAAEFTLASREVPELAPAINGLPAAALDNPAAYKSLVGPVAAALAKSGGPLAAAAADAYKRAIDAA